MLHVGGTSEDRSRLEVVHGGKGADKVGDKKRGHPDPPANRARELRKLQ